MAYRDQRVPRTWNSWRPTERESHPRWAPDNRQPSRNYQNSNGTPLTSWTQRNTVPILQRYEDGLPHLWDSNHHHLMGRTSRAYDLVCNYETACPSGRRWTPEHIEIIREAGKHLNNDIRALQSWRRTVWSNGFDDLATMNAIADDINRMRELCENLQSMISSYEQVPHRHARPIEITPEGHLVSVRGTAHIDREGEAMAGLEPLAREFGKMKCSPEDMHDTKCPKEATAPPQPWEGVIEDIDIRGVAATTIGDEIEKALSADWALLPSKNKRFEW